MDCLRRQRLKWRALLYAFSFFLITCPDILKAEDSLPIAPRRYDDRDDLPRAGFVSLTGEDPKIPGEDVPETAIAERVPPPKQNLELNRRPAMTKKSAKELARKSAKNKLTSRKPSASKKKPILKKSQSRSKLKKK